MDIEKQKALPTGAVVFDDAEVTTSKNIAESASRTYEGEIAVYPNGFVEYVRMGMLVPESEIITIEVDDSDRLLITEQDQGNFRTF